jgi:hypothetical protein
MPKLFDYREFVSRLIWRRNEDGSMSVGVSPVNDKVDYGWMTDHRVRASTKSLFTATSIKNVGGVPQCSVNLTQYVEAGGYIPKSVITKKIPESLSIIRDLAQAYQRDDEIDSAVMKNLQAKIKDKVLQDFSLEDIEAIEKGKEFQLECGESTKITKIASPFDKVEVKLVQVEGDKCQRVTATTVIDASAEECASFSININSRLFEKTARDIGITNFTVKEINNNTFYFFCITDYGIQGVSQKETRSKVTWMKEWDGSIVVDFADTEDLLDEFPVTSGCDLASGQTTWLFRPLDQVGDVPQTAVTFTARLDVVSGGIPASALHKVAQRFLNQVITMFTQFNKSKQIDASRRSQLVAQMKELEVDRSKEDFKSKFDEPSEGKQKVKGAFPLSDAWLLLEGKGKGWGKTTIKVREELEEAAAFFWDFESRINHETTGDFERSVEEKKGKWEVVVSRTKKLEAIHRPRNFWNLMKLHKINKDMIVITMDPTTPKIKDREAPKGNFTKALGSIASNLKLSILSLPSLHGRTSFREATKLRRQGAKSEVTIRFRKRREKETVVEFTTRLELGSKVSDLATKLALERKLDEAADAERYFTNLVSAENMNSKTGEALGADLVWDGGQLGGRHSRTKWTQHVNDVCNDSAALKEVLKKYPWFVITLERARLGELHMNHAVATKLACISDKEAHVIGNNLMPCLRCRKVIKAGVDVWRLQNRAVAEMFIEFPWMESMFIAVGKGVVKTQPWGMMFRVVTGAVTSILDLATDIYVTAAFWQDGNKQGYFFASVISLAASLILQLVLVYLQYKRLGISRVLRESLPCFIGMKPAVDAYRVAVKETKEPGASFDPMLELVGTKICEMFAESIPGVIIQLMAVMSATREDPATTSAWVSLSISALSTGFIGATMSYDYDTDPEKRSKTPDFYGYVPTNGTQRSILFAVLTCLSSCVLVIRCATIVLLGFYGRRWVMGFILADLGLYLFIKIARKDFWYWLQIEGDLLGLGLTEFFAHLLARVLIKLVNDFTSIVQFRHPNEIGGAYWTGGFGLTMISLPLAISFYEYNGGREDIVLKAWTLAQILLPLSSVLLLVFLLSIDARYRSTFFSLDTCKEFVIEKFRQAENDKVKYEIFGTSTRVWMSIEEEVRDWVESKWDKWEADKPVWFDERTKERMPVHYIPNSKARKHEKERRSVTVKERKSIRPEERTFMVHSAHSSVATNMNRQSLGNMLKSSRLSFRKKDHKTSLSSRSSSGSNPSKIVPTTEKHIDNEN